jgi:hypothetical protein
VIAKLELQPCYSSWLGLSRPSTSFGAGNEGVDTRHKAGQDDLQLSLTSVKRQQIVTTFSPDSPAPARGRRNVCPQNFLRAYFAGKTEKRTSASVKFAPLAYGPRKRIYAMPHFS